MPPQLHQLFALKMVARGQQRDTGRAQREQRCVQRLLDVPRHNLARTQLQCLRVDVRARRRVHALLQPRVVRRLRVRLCEVARDRRRRLRQRRRRTRRVGRPRQAALRVGREELGTHERHLTHQRQRRAPLGLRRSQLRQRLHGFLAPQTSVVQPRAAVHAPSARSRGVPAELHQGAARQQHVVALPDRGDARRVPPHQPACEGGVDEHQLLRGAVREAQRHPQVAAHLLQRVAVARCGAAQARHGLGGREGVEVDACDLGQHRHRCEVRQRVQEHHVVPGRGDAGGVQVREGSRGLLRKAVGLVLRPAVPQHLTVDEGEHGCSHHEVRRLQAVRLRRRPVRLRVAVRERPHVAEEHACGELLVAEAGLRVLKVLQVVVQVHTQRQHRAAHARRRRSPRLPAPALRRHLLVQERRAARGQLRERKQHGNVRLRRDAPLQAPQQVHGAVQLPGGQKPAHVRLGDAGVVLALCRDRFRFRQRLAPRPLRVHANLQLPGHATLLGEARHCVEREEVCVQGQKVSRPGDTTATRVQTHPLFLVLLLLLPLPRRRLRLLR
eukprot:Rhum_TRINITY_DN10506_c0_g2::Rhum_TRINITY_DN10506_c0_g2_i1::g.38777::m.38777